MVLEHFPIEYSKPELSCKTLKNTSLQPSQTRLNILKKSKIHLSEKRPTNFVIDCTKTFSERPRFLFSFFLLANPTHKSKPAENTNHLKILHFCPRTFIFPRPVILNLLIIQSKSVGKGETLRLGNMKSQMVSIKNS